MRVFMTGATGYVGGAVARRLRADGRVVVGAARSDRAADRLRAAGLEARPADLFDPAGLAAGAADADAVVSAGYGPPLGDLDALAEAELAAVHAMVGTLHGTSTSPRPFLFTSGSGVLGPTGPRPETEDRPARPAPVLAWRLPVEQEVLAAGRQGIGPDRARAASAVISIPLVHGHGANPVVLDFIPQAHRDGEARYLGAGENHWSAVHVDDLTDLYLLALEALADGSLAPGTLLQPAAASSMPFATLYAGEMRLDASCARTLLGWNPTRPSLREDVAHGSYADAPRRRAAPRREPHPPAGGDPGRALWGGRPTVGRSRATPASPAAAPPRTAAR